MPEKTSGETEAAGDLRGTLVKRLAVAGGLVAVLLGVLAFFDYLATPEEPETTVYTQPVPVAPKKEVTQPVTPVDSLPEPPPASAEPEKAAEASAADAMPKPEVPVQPAVPVADLRPAAKVMAKPEPLRPEVTAVPKPEPLQSPVHPQAARPAPLVTPPEFTAAPAARAPGEARPAPLPVKTLESAQAVQVPSPARLLSGYALQAGVFTSVQRAEELHAKLTLNGIPSALEARVQAGPFKTREEAAAAREKLQALGIDAVLISPKGRR